MSYKVTASDIGAVQLNETDTVRSVLQNIAIILSTRQGTCPLYRGFGLPQKFVDKPLPEPHELTRAKNRDNIPLF